MVYRMLLENSDDGNAIVRMYVCVCVFLWRVDPCFVLENVPLVQYVGSITRKKRV